MDAVEAKKMQLMHCRDETLTYLRQHGTEIVAVASRGPRNAHEAELVRLAMLALSAEVLLDAMGANPKRKPPRSKLAEKES